MLFERYVQVLGLSPSLIQIQSVTPVPAFMQMHMPLKSIHPISCYLLSEIASQKEHTMNSIDERIKEQFSAFPGELGIPNEIRENIIKIAKEMNSKESHNTFLERKLGALTQSPKTT